MFGILTWSILAPILMICEFIVGIFLIAAGIKYRKLLTIMAGLICVSLLIAPIVSIGVGIDIEKQLPISATVYWSLFPLTGLLAIVNGRQITSIRSMGTIMLLTGLLTLIAYQLLMFV
ncbi:ammonia permease [Bacillus cereus]|uniref:ammonia permease n=1 Tax=Bacillus cereus TaxID=1396 RepID=UPI0018791ADF|nr:ammonia permease [Bacillus cereus]MBE7120468.1 ammonia permease [Bacillus cereus]